MWHGVDPFIEASTCLGNRGHCLWRISGFVPLSTARIFTLHILTTLVSVYGGGGRGHGCKAIYHRGHTQQGPPQKKKNSLRESAYMCCHGKTCAYGEHVHVFELLSGCYFVCEFVCVGWYRRMQDGKGAHIFKQWMVNNLWGSTGLKQLEKFCGGSSEPQLQPAVREGEPLTSSL